MSVQDTPSAVQDRTDAPPGSGGIAILFLGAIAIGSLIGLTAPATGAVLSDGVDATLIAMICLLFFELRLRSVLKAFGNLRFLAIAWSANFLIVPLIGFAIVSLILPDQPLFFVGLMIYFLAPCTDWFLGFTRMARGDTELGAALIPINMLSQLMLFPVWLWLFTKQTGLVDFAAIPGLLLQWFLVPLLGAQALRFGLAKLALRPLSERLEHLTEHLVPLVLALLILQIFAGHVGLIAAHKEMFALIALAVFLFFAVTFLVGERLARLGRLDYPQRALLTITMGARNAPLMLVLTAIAIPDQPLILSAIVFGMLIEIPHLTALKHVLLRRSATA